MKTIPTISTAQSMAADTPPGTPEMSLEQQQLQRQRRIAPDVLGDDFEIETNEMYPVERPVADAMRKRADDVAVVLGLTQEEQIARHRAHIALTKKAGLDAPLASMLYNELTDAEIAWTRTPDEPALVARVQRDEEATRAAIREKYGADGADAVMAVVRDEVGRTPDLRALLGTGGVGSKSTVMLALAEFYRMRLGLGYRDADGWKRELRKRRGLA
jgi:hypothetical protein